jgi:nitrite reductase/ring-hydroxylating ferredoxin subunit
VTSRRFPFPIPFGWFQVAYPEDLEPGETASLKYFNRELVLWRDEDGAFHLHDAHCPHLGSDLGVGGIVKGATLQCTFHGWVFDGEGVCANENARLRVYPTLVRNGFVLSWYHPFDEPPQWEIAAVDEIGDPGWSDFYKSTYIIRASPQIIAERGVGEHAVMESYETDGPCCAMQVTSPPGRARVSHHGPGVSCAFVSGSVDARTVVTTTPIDDEHTQLRCNVIVRASDDERTTPAAAAVVQEINQQVQEAVPIWEQQAFAPRAGGLIANFRKWYSQFYAEPDEVPVS